MLTLDISQFWNSAIFLAFWVYLFQINFGWFQKIKNCRFINIGGFEFWFLEKFHTWNVKSSKTPLFWPSKWAKLISRKIWVAKISFIHIENSQLCSPCLKVHFFKKKPIILIIQTLKLATLTSDVVAFSLVERIYKDLTKFVKVKFCLLLTNFCQKLIKSFQVFFSSFHAPIKKLIAISIF